MNDTSAVVPLRSSAAEIVERVITVGDLSELSPADRVRYYQETCHSLGLNPLTRPFEYLKLSGRLTLYARKDACDQLRRLHNVSIVGLDCQNLDGVYIVRTTARTGDGREDVDIGATILKGLGGDALVNAMLKAVTKSKRRVTLSICGLGWLDETEVETATSVDNDTTVDIETGEIRPARPARVLRDARGRPQAAIASASKTHASAPRPAADTKGELITEAQVRAIGDLAREYGISRERLRAYAEGEYGTSEAGQLTKQQASALIGALKAGRVAPPTHDANVDALFPGTASDAPAANSANVEAEY